MPFPLFIAVYVFVWVVACGLGVQFLSPPGRPLVGVIAGNVFMIFLNFLVMAVYLCTDWKPWKEKD